MTEQATGASGGTGGRGGRDGTAQARRSHLSSRSMPDTGGTASATDDRDETRGEDSGVADRSGLQVRGLRVALGGNDILLGLDLSVCRGEILALLGPSGCGKTTLLRAIAGLVPLDGGSVHWAGRDLRTVVTHRRRFGMVFQDHALLPHRNVGANVAFGLRMQGMPTPERRRRVAEILNVVGLQGYERRSVATLSGGEAQRVALARALAPEPKLLLADEPFAALDRPLHDRLVGDVRRILADLGQTAVHVTHDHAEAFALADRVALMRDGRIHRTAKPQELRADPRDAWTATFLGLGTIWHPAARGAARQGAAGRGSTEGAVPGSEGDVGSGGVTPADGTVIDTPWGPLDLHALNLASGQPTAPAGSRQARLGGSDIVSGQACLLIRPEAVCPGRASGVGATVSDVRVVGDRTVATFETPGAPPLTGYVPADLVVGQRYSIALNPTGVTLLRSEP